MDLTRLFQGVEIYNLPISLEKYIQEKTASGFGKVRLLPFAFPVFVMNPFKYANNFKDVLHITDEGSPVALLSTGECPEGEIWEITNIHAQTSAAAGLITAFLVYDGATQDMVWQELSSKVLQWTGGPITLKESERLNVSLPNGNTILSVLGVIKYA